MEDIIDIIVTETTNLIEITSQPMDEVIDVNIIDNREDITLNVTPSVVEININSLTGNFGVNWGDIDGTISNQTDLQNALNLKADLVDGKVPSSQLPSYVDDIVEVANYAALPATGEVGKIYVVLDTNKIYRWSGSAYVEIADSTAVWGAITGTLSSQTDLQNALNAKFDDPTGDTTQYIAGDGSLITFPIAGQAGTLVREVRNTTGATLTKGTIVYISGATGNKPTVSKAIATGDSSSAQTFGMCQADISNNSNGYVVCVGDIVGLDTSAISEGVQLYLSSTTAGTYTTTKQLAPAHLVYIGVVTRSHPTQGQIEVKIQNGYELDEIHDVLITSKANNDGLFYESSTSLWKNKSIATVLGYTPANGANYLALAGGTMTGAIVGTTATFTNSGSGIGLGVTLSGASGDGIKITHSAGRAFNLQSSGSGYGVLINNTTASTSAPFTIQKQGANKITFSDLGAGIFASGLTAETLDLSNTTASNSLRINHTNTSYHAVSITATGGSALYATGSVTVVGSLTATGVLTAQSGLANGSGQSFTLPSTTGTLALTSQLSSYLPLSGGTLTGGLNGTSVSLSSSVTTSGVYLTGMTSGSGALYYNSGANRVTVANYNASGIVVFEVGGGATALTLNANLSATFAAGGSFAGALSGTIATFTNNANVNNIISVSSSTSGAGIQIDNSGRASGSKFSLMVGNLSNGTFSIKDETNNFTPFQIASTGAATFSSSVTANKLIVASDAYSGTIDFGTGIYKGIMDYTAGSGLWKFNNQSGGSASTLYYQFQADGSPILNMLKNGNVGIGTTSPASFQNYRYLQITGGNDSQGGVVRLTTSAGTYNAEFYTESSGSYLTSSGLLAFYTAGSERMRISADGYFKFTDNGSFTTNRYANVIENSIDDNVLVAYAKNTGFTSTVFVPYTIRAAGTSCLFMYGVANGTNTLKIFNNGNIQNTNNSYGAISDIKLKENITDTTSKLSDLLKVKIRNYNLIGDSTKQLGVIAQELEEVFPSLVENLADRDEQGNALSTTTKSVKYSVFVPMLIKAVQELSDKITTLENK